jgi:hypothetical protein
VFGINALLEQPLVNLHGFVDLRGMGVFWRPLVIENQRAATNFLGDMSKHLAMGEARAGDAAAAV